MSSHLLHLMRLLIQLEVNGKFINYILDHNILKLYNVLVQIRLTTSKMKGDIYYSKLGIYTGCLTSCQMTEDSGSQDIRKYQEILISGWKYDPVPSLSSKNATLAIALKKHVEVDIRLFFSCFSGFLYFVPIILPRIVDKKIYFQSEFQNPNSMASQSKYWQYANEICGLIEPQITQNIRYKSSTCQEKKICMLVQCSLHMQQHGNNSFGACDF